MATAAGFGASLVIGGLWVMIHAFLPFLFEQTGSRTMAALHRRMHRRAVTADLERFPII